VTSIWVHLVCKSLELFVVFIFESLPGKETPGGEVRSLVGFLDEHGGHICVGVEVFHDA
jgi:hypothetical protein